MKHFMTREYMLTEASKEGWDQFDVSDPVDAMVMKDFALDNPEDKDHLWNSLIKPLMSLDTELDTLFDKNSIEFLNLCGWEESGSHQAACYVVSHGRFGRLAGFADRKKALANWNEVSRLVAELYKNVKNILIVVNDPDTLNFITDPEKLKEVAEKTQRILNNYRQTRFRKIVKTDRTPQDSLSKVMGRLNDDEMRGVLDIRARNALRLTQDWIDGKLPEGRRRLLLDLLQRLQSGLTGNQRTVRDLKFLHDFVSSN